MGKPVVHFEVYGRNPGPLQEFYKQLFDWHVDAGNPMNYGFVDTHGGQGINGGIAEGEPGVSVVIEVDDLQAFLDKAESLGGKTSVPPTEIPGVVTYAQFIDLEGNRIGLSKSL